MFGGHSSPDCDRWASLQRRQYIPPAVPDECTCRRMEETVTAVCRWRRMRSTRRQNERTIETNDLDL